MRKTYLQSLTRRLRQHFAVALAVYALGCGGTTCAQVASDQFEGSLKENEPSFLASLLARSVDPREIKKVSFIPAPEFSTDEDLRIIATLQGLEVLDLERLETTRVEGPRRLFRQQNVGAPKVTDVGIAYIAKLPRLRFITMSKSQVTDKSCELFADSDSLETIGLDETDVTDAGLLMLARIHSLKYVSVREAKVTAEGVKDFRAKRPDVKVLSNH
jgi:hypothetical protein